MICDSWLPVGQSNSYGRIRFWDWHIFCDRDVRIISTFFYAGNWCRTRRAQLKYGLSIASFRVSVIKAIYLNLETHSLGVDSGQSSSALVQPSQ